MSHLDTREHFRNLDQGEDPAALLRYLDTVADLASVRAYKDQSYGLLQLRPGESVLDVGCGTGDDVRALAEQVGVAGRAVGLDASEAAIAEAVKRSAGSSSPVEFRVGDVHRLDFAAEEFDAARADRVFQHVEDPERAMHEVVRVTRAGGIVMVVEPDWDTLIIDSPDRAVTRQVIHCGSDATRNGWIGRQLRSLFLNAGLRDVGVQGVAVPLTTFELADQVYGLTDIANNAAAAGIVTAEQVTNWLGQLRRSDAIGRFFVSATGYLVTGVKPS